jgi:cytosine/adenosine deaminase-related metal-dependent hydrolase
MADETIGAAWVLPVAAPPIRDGAVVVAGGRLAWVGRRADAPSLTRDLGPGVLLPGLVNAHCHLELSWLRGRLSGARGFVPWVEHLVEARAAEDLEALRAAADEAIAEAVACGTAAVGDVSNTLAHLDLLEASSLHAVVFHELLGWDPGVADRVFASASARRRAHAGAGGRVTVRLAAHAPHSVSPRLLRALVEDGGPAAIHLAEAQAETDFLATGEGEWRGFLDRRGLGHVGGAPPATSPVRYLEALGALHPGLLAAHAVRVDQGDRALLARRGVSVVLCPRSNATLGVGLAPLPELLADGVRVCLGTDSLASAPSLDLLQDAALLHRAYPQVPPRALVRAATAGGAEALGLGDLGTLEPGRRAALAFAPAPAEVADPERFLVSGEARCRRVDA